MTRRPDIAEVARTARVSKSTVSRVINGGYASAEVRERVGKAIRKLDYSPWTTARNFSLGRAGCLGLVVFDTQSEWITQILGGIEEEASAKHVSLLVGSLVTRETYDASTVMSWIRERRVDGLIFACPGRRERPLIEAAKKARVAAALIAGDESFKGSVNLRSDNIGVGRDIAEHLIGLGHRRVAFLGGPADSLDSRERAEGLERGLAEHRVRLTASNKWFAPRWHLEEGVLYAHKWLKMPRLRAPTAIVLANDTMALGFMRTLQAEGVSIPRDVSVVGFDDIPAASVYWPGLTTVRQEMRAMGSRACRALMMKVSGERIDQAAIEFPMKLVIRESTGQAPET